MRNCALRNTFNDTNDHFIIISGNTAPNAGPNEDTSSPVYIFFKHFYSINLREIA